MFVKREYIKEVLLNKSELESKLFKSNEFKTENSTLWGEQISTQSNVSKTYLRISGENELQFSENAGLSGMFEVMGKCNIYIVSENTCKLNLKFTMGNLPINLFMYMFFLCLFFGLFVVFNNQILGLCLLGFALYVLILFLLKKFAVNYILKSFSKALNLENNWS